MEALTLQNFYQVNVKKKKEGIVLLKLDEVEYRQKHIKWEEEGYNLKFVKFMNKYAPNNLASTFRMKTKLKCKFFITFNLKHI